MRSDKYYERLALRFALAGSMAIRDATPAKQQCLNHSDRHVSKRGLCHSCYQAAYWRVFKKETSWREEELAGRATPWRTYPKRINPPPEYYR